MSAALTRRALVAGAGAALGAVALPTAATAPAFDPATYVADLCAVGCRPYAFRSVEGGILGPWRYGIYAPPSIGFGEALDDLAARWRPAMKANPDHGDRVAAYIASGGRL